MAKYQGERPTDSVWAKVVGEVPSLARVRCAYRVSAGLDEADRLKPGLIIAMVSKRASPLWIDREVSENGRTLAVR